MKNSNDTIWNRTRELPACRAVPQQLEFNYLNLTLKIANNAILCKGEVPDYATEACRELEVERHSFLTSKLDGSGQLHKPIALIRRKTSR